MSTMILEKPTKDSGDFAQDKEPYQLGWFSTGRDEAARNLLATVYEKIDELGPDGIEIPFVFSNYEPGELKPGESLFSREYNERQEFFTMVKDYGIELVSIPWAHYKKKYTDEWREYYGEAIEEALQGYPTDLDVAAGFMLWVPDNVCLSRRMINLHPAKPGGPKGTWQEVIWKLIAEGAKETGAQMHRLTPELDEGPAVTYFTFPIIGKGFDEYWTEEEKRMNGEDWRLIRDKLGEGNPLFMKIRGYGEAREIPLLLHTIKEFAYGEVWLDDNGKVRDKHGPLENGYDITKLIEKEI